MNIVGWFSWHLAKIFTARRVQWIFGREFSGRSVFIKVAPFEPPEYAYAAYSRGQVFHFRAFGAQHDYFLPGVNKKCLEFPSFTVESCVKTIECMPQRLEDRKRSDCRFLSQS
jgi:hypothetical protein